MVFIWPAWCSLLYTWARKPSLKNKQNFTEIQYNYLPLIHMCQYLVHKHLNKIQFQNLSCTYRHSCVSSTKILTKQYEWKMYGISNDGSVHCTHTYIINKCCIYMSVHVQFNGWPLTISRPSDAANRLIQLMVSHLCRSIVFAAVILYCQYASL